MPWLILAGVVMGWLIAQALTAWAPGAPAERVLLPAPAWRRGL